LGPGQTKKINGFLCMIPDTHINKNIIRNTKLNRREILKRALCIKAELIIFKMNYIYR
jgi:hypothetical protein